MDAAMKAKTNLIPPPTVLDSGRRKHEHDYKSRADEYLRH